MKIKILSALWGYDHYETEAILDRICEAGYDGVDTFMPDDPGKRRELVQAVGSRGLSLVVQQHQAEGASFDAFRRSFLGYLEQSAEGAPLLINSHTGRDFFSFEENLALVDAAASFSEKSGVRVVHETHRGRFLYSPAAAGPYFDQRPGLGITADLSHWVCVSESFLEGFSRTLDVAIKRTAHLHARVGYEEGPQVPDPRAPEWKYALDHFLPWWDRIIAARREANDAVFTITTEFGPPPYLHTEPFTAKPVADLFEINRFMRDLLQDRYPDVGR